MGGGSVKRFPRFDLSGQSSAIRPQAWIDRSWASLGPLLPKLHGRGRSWISNRGVLGGSRGGRGRRAVEGSAGGDCERNDPLAAAERRSGTPRRPEPERAGRWRAATPATVSGEIPERSQGDGSRIKSRRRPLPELDASLPPY